MRLPNGVHFLKTRDVIVTATAEKTLRGFVNQRMRWVSKAKLVKDLHSFVVAIVVYTTNLLALIGIIFLIFLPDFNEFLFILIFSAKFIVDFIFLFAGTKFFSRRSLMWYFIPGVIINVIYVSIIGVFGSLKKYSWKE